jgi:hypothetical protein
VIVTILMVLSIWRFLRGDPGLRAERAEAELSPGEAAAPLGTAGP